MPVAHTRLIKVESPTPGFLILIIEFECLCGLNSKSDTVGPPRIKFEEVQAVIILYTLFIHI